MKTKLVILLILALALFLRLYRLPELARFNYDEARDASVVRRMILERKPTLLGPETKIGDKTFYFGPLHYYLMAPALAAANFDPIGAYVWTGILGAATVAVIYLATESLLAATFYAVFPLAVIFNRWAWNPNTVPLFASLFLLALLRKRYFWAGVFVGLAIQLHFTAALLAVVVIFWLRERMAKWPWLIVGLLVGGLPMIIFDLRHDFLYWRTAVSLLSADRAYRGFNWHYVLWLLPLLSLWVGKWPRAVASTAIIISAIVTAYILITAKPERALNPQTIRKISKVIASDQKESGLAFNVASFVDPDARATAYRYFLELEGMRPLGVAEYDVADHLYVVTFDDEDEVVYNQTYEIESFRPARVSKSWQIAGENIFRLERN